MEIPIDKKLFWFFKDGGKLDLSIESYLDMYVQQVITCGRAEDIKMLFKNVTRKRLESALIRLKHFLPCEVRMFWEDFIGDN